MKSNTPMDSRGVRTIAVYDRFGEQLATRKSAALLLAEAQSEELRELVLDFRGVNFISRAVAHELLRSAMDIQVKSGIRLLMNNMAPTVHSMVETVKRSMAQGTHAKGDAMPLVGLPVLALSGLSLYRYLVKV